MRGFQHPSLKYVNLQKIHPPGSRTALDTAGVENDPRQNINYISFQTRYQRSFKSYTSVSRVQPYNGTSSNHVQLNRKWKIQDGAIGGLPTWNTCNSACTIDSNVNPSAIPMFSGSCYPMEQVAILFDQTGRNRKWKIQDGDVVKPGDIMSWANLLCIIEVIICTRYMLTSLSGST